MDVRRDGGDLGLRALQEAADAPIRLPFRVARALAEGLVDVNKLYASAMRMSAMPIARGSVSTAAAIACSHMAASAGTAYAVRVPAKGVRGAKGALLA